MPLAKARRAFVRRENEALERFLDDGASGPVVRWSRSYRCDCGHVDHSPGAAWDHEETHRGQLLLIGEEVTP